MGLYKIKVLFIKLEIISLKHYNCEYGIIMEIISTTFLHSFFLRFVYMYRVFCNLNKVFFFYIIVYEIYLNNCKYGIIMDLLVPVFYLALHVHVYSVLQFHQSNFFIACNFHVFFMYLHSNVYHYFYAPVGFSRKRSVLCNQCVSPSLLQSEPSSHPYNSQST